MNNWKRKTYISSPTKNRLNNRRRKSQFWPNLRKFIRLNKNSLLVLVVIILVLLIIRFVYVSTIGKPANVIKEIIFLDEDLQVYDNKDLYTFIREQLRGRNLVTLKLKNGGEQKDIIRIAYPFVEDIHLERIGDGKISAELDFSTADLVFKNEAFSVGYANKFLFLVNENNAIISGALQVDLPGYFSGDVIQNDPTTYISLIGPEKFKNEFTLIRSVLPIDNILLLVGSQKTIITSGNKKITFDHKRNIAAQLEYYKAISSLDPSLFYEIDLTVYPKVIIKKVSGF